MKKIFFFFFFLSIKCEIWFKATTKFDPNDEYGYSGNPGLPITDFYGNFISYRVHYLGSPQFDWSQEFKSGQPVGDGREIDGIAILNNGKGYQVKTVNRNKWLPMVYGYDIYDSKNGYAGVLGESIDLIAIDSEEIDFRGYKIKMIKFSTAFGGKSSNEREVAKRVIKSLYGVSFTFSYEKETTIVNNDYCTVTVILLNSGEFKEKGPITLNIENYKLKNVDWGGVIGDDLNKLLNEVIDFNIDSIKSKIESSYSNEIGSGEVEISYYWLQSRIEIKASSILNIDDHRYLRGGFRVNIYMKEDPKNMKKMKAISRVMLEYQGDIKQVAINSLLGGILTIGGFAVIQLVSPILGKIFQTIIILMLFLLSKLAI